MNLDKTLVVSEQHFMKHARNEKGYVHAKRVEIDKKNRNANVRYATPAAEIKSIMQL